MTEQKCTIFPGGQNSLIVEAVSEPGEVQEIENGVRQGQGPRSLLPGWKKQEPDCPRAGYESADRQQVTRNGSG